MKLRRENLLLYAITDRAGGDADTLIDRVRAALSGGASIVQLRDKSASLEELLREAASIKKLCAEYGAPFIINDSAELAIEAGADGVHIGPKDGNVADVRRMLGADKILGVSARTAEDAVRAEKAGADYIGAGAVFGTSTKADAKPLAIEELKEICAAVSIPVAAIGGINKTNILKLSGSGISGICAAHALFSGGFSAEDTKKEATELRILAERAVYSGSCGGSYTDTDAVRAAVFDVDGTLLDTMPVWDNAAEKFVSRMGGRAEPGLSSRLYKMSMYEGAEYIKKNCGLTISPREIIDGMAGTVIDFYRNEARFKPGAEAFIRTMKANKIPMAVATANERSTVEAAFERLGISDCFAEIITCSDTGTSKTRPDVFIKAAGILGTPHIATWVFEDSFHAIKTAHDAGFPTAAVYDRSAESDRRLIESAADIYMENFWDFDRFYTAASRKMPVRHN